MLTYYHELHNIVSKHTTLGFPGTALSKADLYSELRQKSLYCSISPTRAWAYNTGEIKKSPSIKQACHSGGVGKLISYQF